MALYWLAMRSIVTFGFIVLLLTPFARSEQLCSQTDLQTAIQRVKAIQSQLLAYKIQDEIDEGVPAPLQAQIRIFKESLAALADAALSCAKEDTNPKLIESTLTKLLDANKPATIEGYDPKKPPQFDQIYGDGIDVKVTASAIAPKVLLVDIHFGIECGYDSMLLVYELQSSHWQQVLRWQSGNYDLINGAFGDFFAYQLVQQSGSKNWNLAVAHGHPWCTSRWSAFDLDLIEPLRETGLPQVIFHKHVGYVRDTDPVMKAIPDGIQIRVETGSLDMSLMTRPAIYRYRVSGNQIDRVQPIAMNGRDFVDEWLQSEWSESKNWSSSSGLIELEAAYKKIKNIRNSDINTNENPNFTYGPVRDCSDSPSHFQVELDQGWWVEAQKDWRPDKPTYFQIQEGKNSFTMLSALDKPDPRCTGRDIMPKH
jgi:hypothetical protein